LALAYASYSLQAHIKQQTSCISEAEVPEEDRYALPSILACYTLAWQWHEIFNHQTRVLALYQYERAGEKG